MDRPVCLVTGATGFVGQALCRELLARGYVVRASVRRMDDAGRFPLNCDVTHVKNLDVATDWQLPLRGVAVVVHLAARVHVMRDSSADPLHEFRNINVQGTLNLARQAAAAGVRRFVFASSVKVNGEATALDRPFAADDAPAPRDPYGISKHEAEVGLRKLSAETGIEVVIIRPPLIYGPHVKGNFLRLLQWIERGIPLPFANVDNKRSLLSISNLVDFIARSIDHRAAAGETFLVSDGEDVSTGDLVRHLAAAMGRKPRLFPVPVSLSRAMLKLMGRDDLWQRLFGSLQIDTERARRLLGWTPPVTVAEGMEEVGRWYMQSKKNR